MHAYVHGDTADARPLVTLRFVLEVRATGLQNGLVDAPAARHDADDRAARRGEQLLAAGRHLNASAVSVRLVRDHCGVVAGGARQSSSVAGLLLDAAHHCTLGHLAHWQHVANLQRRFS